MFTDPVQDFIVDFGKTLLMLACFIGHFDVFMINGFMSHTNKHLDSDYKICTVVLSGMSCEVCGTRYVV